MKNVQAHSVNDSHVKVLVVDDHPNTAKMLARAISRLGPNVEVISATSGYEALRHSNNGAADILITDMMMPEMTGLELIKALNDQPSTSPAVSFILTAHDSTALRDLAQRTHVKQVITKPVHPEWICHLILQTMGELKQMRSVGIEPVSQQAQMKKPGTEPGYEILYVDQLLWEVARKLQPQADVKNQLLVVGKTEPNSRVWGSVMQLRQALQNIVWTVIQNTPKGATVILSSEYESNTIKILVRDTGYGVPPAGLQEILDSYHVSPNDHGEDKDAYKQTMTELKSIAKGHGGKLSVESEAGNGTCFTLSLPLIGANSTPTKKNPSTGIEASY